MEIAQFLLNLGAAALLGILIGLERQFRQRLAGLRTIALVSVGVAMFISLSHLMDDKASPTRVVAKFHKLDLRDNRIGDAGAAALATSLPLAGLGELDLGRNRISDAGARSLATGVFGSAMRLGMYNNPLSATGAGLLRARFGGNVFGLPE